MENVWNPWHGCEKYSEGCLHCYVYRRDGSIERDASLVTKNKDFDLPVRLRRDGTYKLGSGTVFSCLSSDFFIDKADAWRDECWSMMKKRADINFIIITKRIVRAEKYFPADWGNGYPNVTICCTAENQRAADERLPVLLSLPIARKEIICEPLLSNINLSRYLNGGIAHVTVGGESGDEARVCRYEWVLSLREQCEKAGVPFYFKQTGARFEKDGKIYCIERKYQMIQARKAGINIL